MKLTHLFSLLACWFPAVMLVRAWWFPTSAGSRSWIAYGMYWYAMELLLVFAQMALSAVSLFTFFYAQKLGGRADSLLGSASAKTAITLFIISWGLVGPLLLAGVIAWKARDFVIFLGFLMIIIARFSGAWDETHPSLGMIKFFVSAGLFLLTTAFVMTVPLPPGGLSLEFLHGMFPHEQFGKGAWFVSGDQRHRLLAGLAMYYFCFGIIEVFFLTKWAGKIELLIKTIGVNRV